MVLLSGVEPPTYRLRNSCSESKKRHSSVALARAWCQKIYARSDEKTLPVPVRVLTPPMDRLYDHRSASPPSVDPSGRQTPERCGPTSWPRSRPLFARLGTVDCCDPAPAYAPLWSRPADAINEVATARSVPSTRNASNPSPRASFRATHTSTATLSGCSRPARGSAYW
jgi:hypothetical protein